MSAEDTNISPELLVEALLYLLRETCEGSPEGRPSAYLDRGVGFLSTLHPLTAANASREFHGTTIAAQTEHAKFYLDRLCEFLEGHTERVNVEDSWLIETVNDKEWDALRETVRTTYEKTLLCLSDGQRVWKGPDIGAAIGEIVHTAYHLGAIRQMIKEM